MPLTHLRLKQFKSFQDSGEVPLAPLTLIFGRNNTGKTTLLQSLLLLRQTLDAPEYGARLNLRGPLYAAGNYSDIVHQHQSRERIVMGFGLQLKGSRRRADLELEFRSDEPQSPRMVRVSISGDRTDPLTILSGRGAGGPYELLIGEERVGGEERAEFRFPLNRFLPLVGYETRESEGRSRREKSRRLARAVIWDFHAVLRDLRVVGAFRRQPERRYEFLGRLPDRVDAVGEHVVNALIEDATRRRGRGELLRSVNRWLNRIGRVRLMRLRRISRTARLFELRVRDSDSGRWANFADVGSGIGQAFPVIIEGLRTPVGGLFVVQEPEIHLHPDAQLAMADLLIALVASGRQVVAETHSEHLLLRVRKRVLEYGARKGSPLSLPPKAVAIIYVDKSVHGTSHTRRLTLDSLGQMKDWPAGFMEESTEERMVIMRQMSRHSNVTT